MKSASLLVPLLFTLAFSGSGFASGSLELIPTPSFRILEGIRIPVVTFPDGNRVVRWQPPSNWQLSGEGNRIMLYPQTPPQAAMEIRLAAPRSASAPETGSTPEALVKWAAAFLPQDAAKVRFDHESPSPFLLEGRPSREHTFEYILGTLRFTTSIAVVLLDEAQALIMIASARSEDFPGVYREATKSMFRWGWNKERALPPTAEGERAQTAAAIASPMPRVPTR